MIVTPDMINHQETTKENNIDANLYNNNNNNENAYNLISSNSEYLVNMDNNDILISNETNSIDYLNVGNNVDSKIITNDEIKTQIRSQLEFYFSRENLIHDKFLSSQMDHDNYVSISTIAAFNMIKKYNPSNDLIIQAIEESPLLQLDSTGTKLRAASKRCIIILREVADDATLEEILNLINESNDKCPACLNCEFAGNRSWYITFKNEDDALKALQFLKIDVKIFKNKPICARIKTHQVPRASTTSYPTKTTSLDESKLFVQDANDQSQVIIDDTTIQNAKSYSQNEYSSTESNQFNNFIYTQFYYPNNQAPSIIPPNVFVPSPFYPWMNSYHPNGMLSPYDSQYGYYQSRPYNQYRQRMNNGTNSRTNKQNSYNNNYNYRNYNKNSKRYSNNNSQYNNTSSQYINGNSTNEEEEKSLNGTESRTSNINNDDNNLSSDLNNNHLSIEPLKMRAYELLNETLKSNEKLKEQEITQNETLSSDLTNSMQKLSFAEIVKQKAALKQQQQLQQLNEEKLNGTLHIETKNDEENLVKKNLNSPTKKESKNVKKTQNGYRDDVKNGHNHRQQATISNFNENKSTTRTKNTK